MTFALIVILAAGVLYLISRVDVRSDPKPRRNGRDPGWQPHRRSYRGHRVRESDAKIHDDERRAARARVRSIVAILRGDDAARARVSDLFRTLPDDLFHPPPDPSWIPEPIELERYQRHDQRWYMTHDRTGRQLVSPLPVRQPDAP